MVGNTSKRSRLLRSERCLKRNYGPRNSRPRVGTNKVNKQKKLVLSPFLRERKINTRQTFTSLKDIVIFGITFYVSIKHKEKAEKLLE